jgi:hypothetical protein
MDDIQLRLEGPDAGERIPPRITVLASDGAWTQGPHAVLEAGNETELTLDELQWLRDVGVPGAIAKLAELIATRGG